MKIQITDIRSHVELLASEMNWRGYMPCVELRAAAVRFAREIQRERGSLVQFCLQGFDMCY